MRIEARRQKHPLQRTRRISHDVSGAHQLSQRLWYDLQNLKKNLGDLKQDILQSRHDLASTVLAPRISEAASSCRAPVVKHISICVWPAKGNFSARESTVEGHLSTVNARDSTGQPMARFREKSINRSSCRKGIVQCCNFRRTLQNRVIFVQKKGQPKSAWVSVFLVENSTDRQVSEEGYLLRSIPPWSIIGPVKEMSF